MPVYTDQIGKSVEIDMPKRIVSLVPSQTELLYDLGLDDKVVGITKFCIHPESWFRSKKRVGGTKQVHVHEVLALQPDLILANKEENVKEQIEELGQTVPIWVSDIQDLKGALNMILSVGQIVSKEEKAEEIAAAIDKGFNQLSLPAYRPSAGYLIWKDPYMTVGGDTFISEMLWAAGFKNAFATHTRYPVITEEEIRKAKPDILLLSSEPYPFKQKHIKELSNLLPEARILLADGEYFSWYGSRLLKAPAYFQQLHLQALSVL